TVERRRADPVLAAHLGGRKPGLLLAQHRNDLLFREPRSLHRPVLPSGRTLASSGGNNGGHSSLDRGLLTVSAFGSSNSKVRWPDQTIAAPIVGAERPSSIRHHRSCQTINSRPQAPIAFSRHCREDDVNDHDHEAAAFVRARVADDNRNRLSRRTFLKTGTAAAVGAIAAAYNPREVFADVGGKV